MIICAVSLAISFILYIREYVLMYREAKVEAQGNA